MSVAARKRSQFRPCIDLHGGKVKQIVGMVPCPAAATAYCKLYTYSNATVAGNIFFTIIFILLFFLKGGTLKDSGPGPDTNFVASDGPAHFAGLYKKDSLTGGWVASYIL